MVNTLLWAGVIHRPTRKPPPVLHSEKHWIFQNAERFSRGVAADVEPGRGSPRQPPHKLLTRQGPGPHRPSCDRGIALADRAIYLPCRTLGGQGFLASIARMRAGARWEAPNIRALAEATLYTGLRKAGVPEEWRPLLRQRGSWIAARRRTGGIDHPTDRLFDEV